MHGPKITQLNEGLRLRDELLSDEMARRRVEIAVVPFGPVQRTADFHPADHFNPQPMTAADSTPMGAAVEYAVEFVAKKALYRSHGFMYFRPWIILITDGASSDNISRAAQLVHDGEAAKAFTFFAVGVDTADMQTLGRLSVQPPLKMRGIAFREFFVWLSGALSGVSKSTPGTTAAIAAPTTWTVGT